MNSELIITLMSNLIENKFYETQDEVLQKLDIYFALNRISYENYTELVQKTVNVYTVEG